MGFPAGYSKLFVPSVVINVAYALGFIRDAICWPLRCIGLQEFLESSISWPNNQTPLLETNRPSTFPVRIRDSLPVVTFSILAEEEDNICAVCLSEMKHDDKVRHLGNCKHTFHVDCVDKWVDYDHRTCPLCRSIFISEEEVSKEL